MGPGKSLDGNLELMERCAAMKVAWISHFKDGDNFRVMVRCDIPQQVTTKWKKFIAHMNGFEATSEGFHRFHTPVDDYRGNPEVMQALNDNQKTLRDMVERHELQQRQKEGEKQRREMAKKNRSQEMARLFTSHTEYAQMNQMAARMLQRDWESSACRDLQELSLLEVHRRIVLLEDILQRNEGLVRMAVASLSELRGKAMAPKRYLIVDPLTMCVPFLFNRVLKDSVKDIAVNRSLAIRASMEAIMQYGMALTQIAKQTSGDTLYAATPWLFEAPFVFLPAPMRQPMPDDTVEEIVTRRRDKEQDDARNALRVLKILESDSPLVTMYNKMRHGAMELLARDSVRRNYTKFLPPTPSMPDAKYDPVRFLEQLAET